MAPGSRVVYVDNDPIVHVHANALLTGSGTTSIVLADLREPEAILAHPKVRALIDFSRPVALLLIAILHFITEEENPGGIVATLRDALPSGSFSPCPTGPLIFIRPEHGRGCRLISGRDRSARVAPLRPGVRILQRLRAGGAGAGAGTVVAAGRQAAEA